MRALLFFLVGFIFWSIPLAMLAVEAFGVFEFPDTEAATGLGLAFWCFGAVAIIGAFGVSVKDPR